MSLGTKILIGVLAGIACGVLLGEWAAPADVVGKIYIALLQMTVLPYVTVSLVQKIGGMSFDDAKRLGSRAGLVIVALWVIALAVVAIMPLSLPRWDAGTFFSSSLVEQPPGFDFLGLYLPTNPFHSLANNVVPAVVLFSIIVGVALIAVPSKQRILEPLGTVSETLSNIAGAIVKLSPFGTFALTAAAAGTLSPGEMARLAGYVSTYTIAIVLLAFVVLPGFVAAITPFRFVQQLRGFRDAVLTAFATGKLFAVLPMVIRDSREMLMQQGISRDEAQATADVFVPLGYPFPNAGKILSLLFVPFAAWFIGQPLEPGQYPMLLTVGLFAFFGSPVAAIPFLLDMLRLPSDLLPLFLIAGIWCARLGDVLGAVHLGVFTLICSAWNHGWLRLNAARLGLWLGGSVIAGGVALAGNFWIVSASLAGQEKTLDRVAGMDLFNRLVEIKEVEAGPNPEPLRESETFKQRVRRTRVLRVGWTRMPPFCYRNADGKLVGYDVDLAQLLAFDFDPQPSAKDRVALHLVPLKRTGIAAGLAADQFDIAIGQVPSSIQSLGKYRESVPYEELHAALIVPDHRVKQFRSLAAMVKLDELVIGYEKGGVFVNRGRTELRGVEVRELSSPEPFLNGEVDAFLTTAETGAVLTMMRPEFAVVVPGDVHVVVPVVFALKDSDRFQRLIDRWISLKRYDGTLKDLREHWILGKNTNAGGGKKHRWSVVHDVLGWGR